MKDQVLSIEQMQELIGMGVDVSKASMYWYIKANPITKGWDKPKLCMEEPLWPTPPNKVIPTFTLQDILNYLENIKPILTKDDDSIWFMEVHNLERDSLMYCEGCESDSSLGTAFNTLKWCKENNFI